MLISYKCSFKKDELCKEIKNSIFIRYIVSQKDRDILSRIDRF